MQQQPGFLSIECAAMYSTHFNLLRIWKILKIRFSRRLFNTLRCIFNRKHAKKKTLFQIFKRTFLEVLSGDLSLESLLMYSRIEWVFTCNMIMLCFPGARNTFIRKYIKGYVQFPALEFADMKCCRNVHHIVKPWKHSFHVIMPVMICTVYRDSLVEVHTSSRSKHNSCLKNTPFCNV